ncbi:MAG TPA: ribosome-binding factor A, partial [Rudaea sp.]|nr:ribosome-binding factor A [Rudaea sp.]
MHSHSFNRADRLAAELRRLVGTLVHDAVREHALPS